MCEPRNRDNRASDLWTLTAYCAHPSSLCFILKDSYGEGLKQEVSPPTLFDPFPKKIWVNFLDMEYGYPSYITNLSVLKQKKKVFGSRGGGGGGFTQQNKKN